MEEIYKLSLKNIEYWEGSFDAKEEIAFKRIDKPCHIYVTNKEPFVTDKMICNFEDASDKKYLWCTWPLGTRLREYKDFVVIEPSGIMVPKSNFKLVKDEKEIMEDRGIDIRILTDTSYFCNLISDLTRGGLDKISYDKANQFRQELLKQSSKPINQSFLSSFEFAYMFIDICNKKEINTFNYYELLSSIISKSNKPEYLPLIWNIDFSVGEHYESSNDLFSAFALLRYIGLTYPNYDDESKYATVNIDSNINKYPKLISGKEDFYPFIEQFVDDFFGLSNQKSDNRCKTKTLTSKNKFNRTLG